MFGLHMGRMGGAGRVRGSAPIWTPAANFPLGTEPGLWYDPSTFTGLYQDSAGTSPATAVGQPVGKMLDKSGRNNHISQATASARPIIGAAGAIQYTTFDGLDDGMSTGAITLGSDMDCYIVLRRKSSKKFVLMYSAPTVVAVGVGESGDSATATSTGGTYAVNGVVVPGGVATTRDQLHAAIPVGEWVVVELRNNNLSAFPSVGFGGYSYGYQLDGDIAGIILCPAGDAAARQKNRQWLGNKAGLTLP